MTIKIRYTSYEKATNKRAWFFSFTPGSQLLLTLDVADNVKLPVTLAKAVTVFGVTIALAQA